MTDVTSKPKAAILQTFSTFAHVFGVSVEFYFLIIIKEYKITHLRISDKYESITRNKFLVKSDTT
jgi:hypothetical protein